MCEAYKWIPLLGLHTLSISLQLIRRKNLSNLQHHVPRTYKRGQYSTYEQFTSGQRQEQILSIHLKMHVLQECRLYARTYIAYITWNVSVVYLYYKHDCWHNDTQEHDDHQST